MLCCIYPDGDMIYCYNIYDRRLVHNIVTVSSTIIPVTKGQPHLPVYAAIYMKWNNMKASIGKWHIYSFIKCKLFQRYCCSFYGAPLWSLNSEATEDICIAWRKALRMLWGLHPNDSL